MRTRIQLENVLRNYPPALANVLALDPSLITNQPYLAPYPDLANFLNQHPEIARNPNFYIPLPERRVVVESSSSNLGPILVLVLFMALAIWLVRTIVDYRRWNRLAKIQTDVHTKILDRFTENADLLAYIQSHAGRRFLESSPIMLDAAPSTIAAPLGRILWSVQAGIVLALAGGGVAMVATRFPISEARPLQVLSALAMALGTGFVISAGASYLISRKLGLITPSAAPETPRPEQSHKD
jgi:hypothetical protein